MIDIATELSKRLSDFGQSATSRIIIERAIAANDWFSHQEICRSVEAISSQMLSKSKLEEWLAHYPNAAISSPRRIAIIMAGNIPLVGFFDLLCTLLSGHHAWIKPSSKDRILMEYICELLREIEKDIPIYIYDDSLSYDAIIATGGTQANQHFESRFKECKRLCRSNRNSIALLTDDTTPEQMDLLAEDIYAYSALGCRNVSMIIAPKGTKVNIPRYETSSKYRNNYLKTRALLTIKGLHFQDNGCSVAINSKALPSTLSTISIWQYESLEEVEEWIAEHDNELQCIVTRAIEHPRRVDFGEAQHPTLFDYADGVDTMKFLEFND